MKFVNLNSDELDRRSAQNIGNIFFKTKKIQMKQIQDKVWLFMKKKDKQEKTKLLLKT